MNIQQFEYILAVAELKHFESAAEKCSVTQSTLSTMISRFESEAGIKIFNRKTRPVSVTQEGAQVIERLRIIHKEVALLKNEIQEMKGEMVGELSIGIIPTVAPYLLPLFLSEFASHFPKVKMIIQEMTTAEIQKALHNRTLDIGILATPLEDEALDEVDLYSEPFLVYDCTGGAEGKKSVAVQELDYSRLWFLEEGHCLRTQVQQICELASKRQERHINFEFKAGSLDSLLRFTRANQGITILPFLAALDLPEAEKACVVSFTNPVPARSVGLVTHKHFVKKRLLGRLQVLVLQSVEPMLPVLPFTRHLKPV